MNRRRGARLPERERERAVQPTRRREGSGRGGEGRSQTTQILMRKKNKYHKDGREKMMRKETQLEKRPRPLSPPQIDGLMELFPRLTDRLTRSGSINLNLLLLCYSSVIIHFFLTIQSSPNLNQPFKKFPSNEETDEDGCPDEEGRRRRSHRHRRDGCRWRSDGL